MKFKIVALLAGLTISAISFSQIPLTVSASGGNMKASVSERIGLTDIVIHYDRPGVKGREGKIWGQLVHTGFADQGFGSSKSAPWRAGANENTTIEFSSPVKIEGQSLPAGKYGFFIAFDPTESTLIFSRNSSSWGSYYYDDKEDALRVKVKPVALDKSVEWLKYEFLSETENKAVIALQWEKLMIPFTIETDYINEQLASFRKELRSDRGFIWEGWDQAANWCLQHNVNLEQALVWTDSSTGPNFGGDRSFQAWTTKAQLLEKLNRPDEATAIMKKTIPIGNVNEVHAYGRQLMMAKKNKEALEVFKANFQKFPNQFTTLMGLARGYSASGDLKNGLKYANQALPLAPNPQSKTITEGMIAKLKEGENPN